MTVTNNTQDGRGAYGLPLTAQTASPKERSKTKQLGEGLCQDITVGIKLREIIISR